MKIVCNQCKKKYNKEANMSICPKCGHYNKPDRGVLEGGASLEEHVSSEEVPVKNSDMLYLIQPNMFKMDVTFRVLARGEYLYFCRCGGQMYGIDIEKPFYSEAELLAHKDSFRIRKDEVQSISIDSKRSSWTGAIPNEGVVLIETTQKKKYIIHPINTVADSMKFFKKNTSCEVSSIVDPKRKYIEKADKEMRESYPEITKRLKLISNLLVAISVLACVGFFLLNGNGSMKFIIILLSIIPIIATIIYVAKHRYSCLIDLSNEKRTVLALPVLVPTFMLFFIGFFSVQHRESVFTRSVLYSLILAAILSIVILFITKEYRRSKWVVLGLLLIYQFYFISVILTTNTTFDSSESTSYFVFVHEKEHVESRGPDDYNIYIDDWTGQEDLLIADVGKTQFERFDVGDEVRACVHKGLWGLEWYHVFEIDE